MLNIYLQLTINGVIFKYFSIEKFLQIVINKYFNYKMTNYFFIAAVLFAMDIFVCIIYCQYINSYLYNSLLIYKQDK